MKQDSDLSISALKEEARRIQAERQCIYSHALDLVANRLGFQRWSLLMKHAPDGGNDPEASFLRKVESVYADIARFFRESRSDLTRPVSQRGTSGFAALYTAPRRHPDLLIVGQNPGNFGPDDRVWDDEPNRMMMSGRVPTFNSYLVHEHNFGRELRRYFTGVDARLLEECVGLNVWFFQARGTPDPDPELATFCEEAARRLARLIEPKAILCLSRKAFDVLRTGTAALVGDGDASFHVSLSGSIPLACAHHPTGRWTRDRATKSVPAAIGWINGILSGRQDLLPVQADRIAAHATALPSSSPKEVILPTTEILVWKENFSPRRFSFAHEAAQHILDTTQGQASDKDLNSFVLAWGAAVGKPLKNTEGQNRNRVVKYRKSWLKHGHCRDMNA